MLADGFGGMAKTGQALPGHYPALPQKPLTVGLAFAHDGQGVELSCAAAVIITRTISPARKCLNLMSIPPSARLRVAASWFTETLPTGQLERTCRTTSSMVREARTSNRRCSPDWA